MSSLRLALKQSLEEAGPPPPRKKTVNKTGTGRPRGRPPKRKPGDPPRKRGRPRKHPLPEEIPETKEDDASSSEAEFSVSQVDSDSEAEEEHHESSEDEEARMRKERKMQKKAMKRERNFAANKIQNHWKKKRKPNVDETMEPKDTGSDDGESEKKTEKKFESSGRAKTVPPPDPDLVEYMRGLSVKKQKRNMTAGLRVKVRFATKVRKRDGKVATKLKWYGGLVTRVSTGGSKIRIKYDDGTSEVSKFPDKDVIVDDTGNGEHRVSAGRFIPPSWRAAAVAEEEPRNREQEEPNKQPAAPRKVGRPRKVVREEEPATPKRKVGRPRKVVREEEPAKTEPEPDVKEPGSGSNESTPSVKSPKKATSFSPKKQVGDSPEHNEEKHGVSANNEEDSHGDSDVNMDDAAETGPDADGSEVQQEASSKRKKLSLKIRLKGPKASIITSNRYYSAEERDHTEDVEDEHGEDNSNADDDISVDEVSSDKDQADEEVGAEGDAPLTKDSQGVEDSSKDAGTASEKDVERNKRAYDKVSRDEGLGEPPKKKRAADKISDSAQAVDAEQGVPGKLDSADVGKDNSDISSKSSDDAEDFIETLPERKRKRDEEDSQSESPLQASASPTPESADLKTSSSDAEVSKPVSTIDESSKEGGNEEHADGDVEPAVSKTTGKQNETAPSKDISSEKMEDEANVVAPKSPSAAQGDESAADDGAEKQVAATSIPRFGRRAAQEANERIAARKERIIIDEFAKKKRQRRDKGDGKSLSPSERRKKGGGDESGDDEVDGEWVQCDNCSKWRILPSNVQTSDLPKHWYCEMNVYDPERSTCDAPEQTAQEILKEKRRRKRKLAKIARLEAAGKIDAETAAAQRLALDNKERKSARSKARFASRSPNPRDSQDSGLDSGKMRKKRGSPIADEESDLVDSPPQDTGNESQKSRSFKKLSTFGSTGRRSNKPEADDMGSSEALVEAEPVPKKRGRGRPPRARTNKDAGNGDKGKSGKSSTNDVDNQEWVACEKCQKWRRLPSHVSADSLPDKWYCSMNTWDPLSATCDAEEDKADPGHHEFGIYGSGVSTASYGNKLSYRNLIFGTGRKQNRPITERTRAAESLFLAPTDPSSESSCPKVMYANSSVFMPRLSNAQKANAPDVDKRMTLFELMNHSNLWAELRAASNMPQPDKLGSSFVNSSYTSLSDDMKKTMKDMVLRAINSGTLASDEVLLETQCRQWTDVPQEWAEIRATCTIDKIEGTIGDLVADGRIERVMDASQTDLSAPKYRRVSTASTTLNKALRPTRCMKIAKPWKKARPNATHEGCK